MTSTASRTQTFAAVLFLFSLSLTAAPVRQSAAPPQNSAPPQAAASPAPPHATLADFAWLTGRWLGKLDRLDIELVWLAPKNGAMLGTARFLDGDKPTALLELFTIRETPEGIAFYLRHFSTDLVPREKEGPLFLKLASADATRFEFLNPTSTRPKTFILTRNSDTAYTTHLDIIDDNGKTNVIEVVNHRIP